MNVNEYGIQIQFGVSFNMVSNTSLTFMFTRPDGTTFNRSGSLGTSTISTPSGVFAGNTYATYITQSGDINQTGSWSLRLIYQDASPAYLTSTIVTFTVYA